MPCGFLGEQQMQSLRGGVCSVRGEMWQGKEGVNSERQLRARPGGL